MLKIFNFTATTLLWTLNMDVTANTIWYYDQSYTIMTLCKHGLVAGGYSSDAQKTTDILDLTTQTIPWGGNLNKIPTQPYLAGPIRRSRYPIWPYGPIFVPYIYSTFEDVLYSFKFAKWWIRGYIFWFIPGSPWHHWCGQQGGDSQHHLFWGCIGARLVDIYIVISTLEYHLMTNTVHNGPAVN